MKLNNLLFVTTVVLISMVPVAVLGETDQVPGLLKPIQLEAKQISLVTYYHCSRNTQCTVRCAAGEGHVSISYSNVRRLEIGTAEKELLIGIHHVDPVGKSHVATSFVPLPASCVFDDLVMDAAAPVEDGNVLKPSQEQDVIFDVQPDR